MNQYLKETYYLDFSVDTIQELIEEFRSGRIHDQIGGLFLKIRDGWRYNPYKISGKKEHYRASEIVKQQEGHCVDKSVLFVAGLRALGIPARLRLAKVINHIAAERLTEKLGTHYITPHGISEVYANGHWYKASNAFNQSLCDKYNVDALYFDGTKDAMIQPYNRDDNKYMEYVEDYGSFEDVPFDFILSTFKENYPAISSQMIEDRFEI